MTARGEKNLAGWVAEPRCVSRPIDGNKNENELTPLQCDRERAIPLGTDSTGNVPGNNLLDVLDGGCNELARSERYEYREKYAYSELWRPTNRDALSTTKPTRSHCA